MDALTLHRLHFSFTITFHYLFPQLTMGLALLILILKTAALRTGNDLYERGARFWIRIFAINFALGVVTGIPMEFQFGTNWSRFARAAGGVIGQSLALEGIYSFFLESTFLGLLLYGGRIVGRTGQWVASLAMFVGTWLSGYFIIVTGAWMQHPVGYKLGPKGEILLADLTAFLLNPWALWQYLHNMLASLITASFVVASVGAFYLLARRDEAYGRLFVGLGVTTGFVASLLTAAAGDVQGKMVARYQPATLAAMEALFETREGAPMMVLGQPDVEKRRIDNPLLIPNLLSFISYRRWTAEVKGLDAFPRDQWPDNIPLLYYSFHIMVGLGTIFIAVSAAAAYLLWRGTLFDRRAMLWVLLLMFPLPYIANTAGWMTAELGRQPWIIYGLMRTSEGASMNVSAGNALFTLLGFMGLYTVLGILGVMLVWREIESGPEGGH